MRSILILTVVVASVSALPTLLKQPIELRKISYFPKLPLGLPFGGETLPGKIGGEKIQTQTQPEDSSDEDSKDNNNNNKVNLNIFMNGNSGNRNGDGVSNSVVVNFNFNEQNNSEQNNDSLETTDGSAASVIGKAIDAAKDSMTSINSTSFDDSEFGEVYHVTTAFPELE